LQQNWHAKEKFIMIDNSVQYGHPLLNYNASDPVNFTGQYFETYTICHWRG